MLSSFNIYYGFQIVSELTGAGDSSTANADGSSMCSTNDEAEMVCADIYNVINTICNICRISKMQVVKLACPVVMLKFKLDQKQKQQV